MCIIIFGCGNVGIKTMDFLGRDNIKFFSDNNPNIVDKCIYGIQIISYQSLLEKLKNDNVLLVLGVNGHNAEIMSEQLEKDEIFDYVVAGDLPGFDTKKQINHYDLEALMNPVKRQQYVIRYLRRRLEKEKGRVEYFKRHADISHMSPATGHLRERQLCVVERAYKTITFLNNYCPILCWITGGTLIGKLRHNGFVPWDDDVDFGVMRGDVIKLIKFFYEYSAVFIWGEPVNNDDKTKISSDIVRYNSLQEIEEKFGDRYFLMIMKDFIRICSMSKGEAVIELELFPFDYYKEKLTINEYALYVSDGFVKKKEMKNDREWFNYCYNQIEGMVAVSKEPTNKILPGNDSFIYRGLWNIEEFLPEDVLFPLREVEFEGYKFLCPNNPEKYLQHEYPDWRSFPDDVGATEE